MVRDKTLQLYFRFRELFLYGVIGGASAAIDFGIYTLLTSYMDMHYQTSNVISVLCGIVNSFMLNSHFNFKTKDNLGKRFLYFLSIGMLGLLISAGGLYIGVDLLSMKELWAKLVLIPTVALIQFLLNKYYTFRKWI
ncbi:MAG: GtrA family protein [Bacteroidota bacterium]